MSERRGFNAEEYYSGESALSHQAGVISGLFSGLAKGLVTKILGYS